MKEIILLKELATNFTQAVLDSKQKIDYKPLKAAKKFQVVFAQLYFIALGAKVTSDKKATDLFEFLGSKLNAANKEEYKAAKEYFLDHLRNNGVKV